MNLQAKIGMVSSYPNLNQTDWLWQQTPHPFGQWKNIQMLASDPNPDFLLLYQYDFNPPVKPQRSLLKQLLKPLPPDPPFDPKSLFRNVPKERIIYLLREPPLEETLTINQRNYQQAKEYCNYVSGPDQFAPSPDYMPAIWYHNNSFRELNEMPIPEKVKPCSWITSGISRTENHRQRLGFLALLKENQVKFDLYGRGLPAQYHPLGAVKNKWYALSHYHYNLAIENYADNEWYVSEKMWDSLLAWCLPIYYGGSGADQLLPEGSFLRLPSLDEKGLQFIQDVTSNLEAWHSALPAIKEARQIILHKLNLLEWLSNYVRKF